MSFSIERTAAEWVCCKSVPYCPASGCCATLRRGRLHFGCANLRPVFANGLPGRKKGNQISSVAFVKPGGGCVTCQRTLLIAIFYVQTIEKFVVAIPDMIESHRTAKKVSGKQKSLKSNMEDFPCQKFVIFGGILIAFT